jgi:hypothetical protein
LRTRDRPASADPSGVAAAPPPAPGGDIDAVDEEGRRGIVTDQNLDGFGDVSLRETDLQVVDECSDERAVLDLEDPDPDCLRHGSETSREESAVESRPFRNPTLGTTYGMANTCR